MDRNNKGQFVKGHDTWNKGIKQLNISGKNNYLWKGDNVGYRALHRWIENQLGKANHCSNPDCIYPRTNSRGVSYGAPKRYHWSNISHQFKRVLEDWRQLCPSCHKLYDNGKLLL